MERSSRTISWSFSQGGCVSVSFLKAEAPLLPPDLILHGGRDAGAVSRLLRVTPEGRLARMDVVLEVGKALPFGLGKITTRPGRVDRRFRERELRDVARTIGKDRA